MNRNMRILAPAAVISGLAACADRGGENAAMDQNVLQPKQENVLPHDAGNTSSSAPVDNVDAVTPAEAPEAPRGAEAPSPQNEASFEKDDSRRPPLDGPPPPPEADPHAGHDMNNKADMPHD